MQSLAQEIHSLLLKNRQTLAVAESASGGLLSKTLTDIPGSSRYFLLGIVAYSNNAKEKLLRIPSGLIHREGAVSSRVASLMAQNIRKLSGSDFGIGITGIAGPTGGSREKPVGTVFIVVAGKKTKLCRKFVFGGNRLCIRRRATLQSLTLLKNLLKPSYSTRTSRKSKRATRPGGG